MRIFITGGTGFIGKHLVKKLKEDKNNELFLLSKDLADIKTWKKEVEDFRPEAAIHLAWEGLPNYDSQTSIKNLKYGLNLINILAEIGCKTILSAGSCWEYGEQSGKLTENTSPKSFNAFAAAKNSLHLLGKEIAKENNIQFIWTRFFYVYGPGQRETSLIPYLMNCVQNGKTPEIKNPFAKNDFIYVEDITMAISQIIENCKESAVYNIGSGYLTSIQEVIKIIFDNYGLQNQYKEITPASTDVLSAEFYADISKIKKEIGWEPKISINEGIKKMINISLNNK